MTRALASKSLNPMRPRERQLGLIRWFNTDRLVGLTTTTGVLAEEGDSEDSTTTTKALLAEVEGIMLPKI